MFQLLGSGAFFDVKVFNPTASSYRATPVASLYRRFEKEKRRKYEQRIREVEMGSFTPAFQRLVESVDVPASFTNV